MALCHCDWEEIPFILLFVHTVKISFNHQLAMQEHFFFRLATIKCYHLNPALIRSVGRVHHRNNVIAGCVPTSEIVRYVFL